MDLHVRDKVGMLFSKFTLQIPQSGSLINLIQKQKNRFRFPWEPQHGSFLTHRQRPVDARDAGLQPEQVHEEEDEEGDEEPQRHHLEELEGVPAGPAVGAVDAQEGDEQGQLQEADNALSQ